METQDECFTRGPHELCFYSGSHYCNAIKVCSHYRNSQQILFFSIDQIYCLLKKCHWLENIIYLFQIMEWNISWIFLFNIHELIYSLGLNLKCNLGWSHRNSVDESKRNKSRQPCILKYGAPGAKSIKRREVVREKRRHLKMWILMISNSSHCRQ